MITPNLAHLARSVTETHRGVLRLLIADRVVP
jgi:hypothetical protein